MKSNHKPFKVLIVDDHRPQVGVDPAHQLTDRELQIFKLIGKAHSTSRIAKELFSVRQHGRIPPCKH